MDELLTISPGMPSSTRKNITAVISRFGQRLMGFIRQRVGSEADAEDILQDVWYQLTTTVDTEPIEQVSGWLFAVARNKIIDRYRKKRPESLDMLLQPAGRSGGSGEAGNNSTEEGPDLASILLDNSSNPETANLRALFWKALQDALEELPEEQRIVFEWHELTGLSFKEIADLTGENVNTLISRKRYAVIHLRARLLTLYHEIIEH
ncbi:MAG TPA: sigma-70 family RNA polymerase sigma factor [Puia sp.]|nr:sigma-70 family RNA polymerase sigma factor [Puia sp.]